MVAAVAQGGCRPSVSNKTLCAVYASGQKITKLLAEHHWFLGGFGCFSISFACLRNNGLLHVFGESFACRGQSGGEICCRGCRGRKVEERVVLAAPLSLPLVHTVAMMTNKWAMSLTLCRRSGAMRARFSLENSQEGKMWIT